MMKSLFRPGRGSFVGRWPYCQGLVANGGRRLDRWVTVSLFIASFGAKVGRGPYRFGWRFGRLVGGGAVPMAGIVNNGAGFPGFGWGAVPNAKTGWVRAVLGLELTVSLDSGCFAGKVGDAGEVSDNVCYV